MVAVWALLVTWLLTGEGSPFHDYFIWHVELPNTWAMTTVIPFIFSAIITGNPHSPSIGIFILAMIIQWSVLGFLLSIPIANYLHVCRSSKKNFPRYASPPFSDERPLLW